MGRWLCRNVAVNWDEGGMPWTCLPGEPSNVNWCNSAQGSELYKNPPKGWLGASDHGKQSACISPGTSTWQWYLSPVHGTPDTLCVAWGVCQKTLHACLVQGSHTTPLRSSFWATSPTMAPRPST